MISVEKPGSPSEILEHAGVKGMKWGVQKAVTKSAGFKLFSKAANANVQRYNARQTAKRNRKPTQGIAIGRSSREFRAQNPTAKLQARAIRTARKESDQRLKTIRKTKDSVEKARLLRDHNNNPGTPVAMRLTRGEKITGILLTGIVPVKRGPEMVTGLALGIAAQRRAIERKQRRGGFQ